MYGRIDFDMKFIFLFFNSLFIFFSGSLYASQDTLSFPSWKTYLHGSLQLLTGVQPTKGRFYSNDWSEHEEPHVFTGGYQFGLNAAKRVSKKVYLLSGAEISWFKLGKFRMSAAPDLRYTNPNGTYYDTTYTDYSQAAMHVPVCIVLPVLSNNANFVWQLGVVNDFTFSESYNVNCIKSGNGVEEYAAIPVSNNGINYTATRLHASIRFDSVKNRTIVMFLSGINSSPLIINHEKENFLRYSFVFFFRLGVGYAF
jgi:hypothetical protein